MKEFRVEGMKCVHCQKRVHDAVAAVPGVDEVTVNLENGIVAVEGTAAEQAVTDAVEQAGYACEVC